MQSWQGWTAETPTTMGPTWAEWCAWQQRTLRGGEHCLEDVRFTDKELARLSFLRWLYQTGHLDPHGRDTV